jgi:hypothetical protein
VNCNFCNRVLDDARTDCPSCGKHTGFPNVRIAETPEEKEALEARYSTALASAVLRGASDSVEKFDVAVGVSSAVVTMNLDTLRVLATDDKALFTSYHLAVRAQVRRTAKMPFDQHRCAVDGKMWGSAGAHIRYAALSLDGRGLSSYGTCFVKLRESHIAHRASVLESNTFDFLETIAPGQELPLGYRSNWTDRHKVAVAKCVDEIKPASTAADFGEIILKSNGNRAEDEFIEVHIFGTFDMGAVESVRIAMGPRNRSEAVALEIVKEIAQRAGIGWEDGDS